MSFIHTPVLLQEVVESLKVKKNHWYVDATAGGGGHSDEILRLGGRVIAVDQDRDAIEHLRKKYSENKHFYIVCGNFGNLKTIVQSITNDEISGVLFDLGFSSNQVEQSGRGFSFLRDEPLDMRMDLSVQQSAHDIVNRFSQEELTEIFMKYGEEEHYKKIAQEIVKERKRKKIDTSKELADIVSSVVKNRGRGIHPATRIFQALRMVVNQELENLQLGLNDAFDLLESKGRLSVMSFHSLEDRVVKQKFNEFANKKMGTVVNKKPIIASVYEIKKNKRSRSAKLRTFEKV